MTTFDEKDKIIMKLQNKNKLLQSHIFVLEETIDEYLNEIMYLRNKLEELEEK